jgi:hypothetical protein
LKPTKPLTLFFVAVVAAIAGYFACRLLIGAGHPVPVAELNTLITLPALAVVLIGLAWPVIRYRRQLARLRKADPGQNTVSAAASVERPKRVDPFYAVRLLALAKASSLAGAAFAGWHFGIILVQLASPAGATQSVASNAFAVVGSLILIGAALFVEFICRIPQDGDTVTDAEVKPARGGSGAAAA